MSTVSEYLTVMMQPNLFSPPEDQQSGKELVPTN